MERLRPADEANRGHAVAPAVERVVRRRHDGRVVREAEIVVRAEVQELAATLDLDVGTLSGRHDELGLVGARRAQVGQRLCKLAAQSLVHV